MGDAVAITAICVSGAVTVGSAGIAVWGASRRQQVEFERQSLVELRGLLEEGADALGRGKRCYERIYHLHREGVPRDDKRALDAFADRGEAMRQARHMEARIAIRLGQGDEVYETYLACIKALDRMADFAHAYERSKPLHGPLADQELGHLEYRVLRPEYIENAKALIELRF